MRLRIRLLPLMLAIGLAASPGAHAQSVSIQSIPDGPVFGDVSSAPTGDTMFRAKSIDGMVTRETGTGYRITSGTTRAMVTVACGSNASCRNREVNITVSSIGTPTGRAKSLSNFTVTMGTAQLRNSITGTNPVSFRIAAIGQNASATFYVGGDFTIYGNESTRATGTAKAQFQVVATMTPNGGTASGLGNATASVRRALGVKMLKALSFGTIARPITGTGGATIDPGSGNINLTGNRIKQMPGTVSRGEIEISGEGGQSFSLSVPASFNLSGPGGQLAVQTTTSVTGLQSLDGAIGTGSKKVIGLGGSVQIPYNLNSGTYSGSVVITVQYQ